MPYNPLRDPQSSYNNPKKGPHASGAPGGGIPLHGDLSPEQEAWMGKGRPKRDSGANRDTIAGRESPVRELTNSGTHTDEGESWHNHEETNDGESMVRHAHFVEGGMEDHTHPIKGSQHYVARDVHPMSGRQGM